MKIQSEFLPRAMIIACATLSLLSEDSFAQENGQTALIAQHQNQKSQVSFVVGQNVGYKTVNSKKFINGRITKITDSTISFEHKDHEIKKVFHRNLTAFKLMESLEIIDLRMPMTGYNLKHMSIKLKSGKKIFAHLISVTRDSLLIRVSRKEPLVAIGYAEIKFVGIHKKGSEGIGALIGGVIGGGIGAIIGAANRPSNDPSGAGAISVPAGAILGIVIGIPIGAVIGSANKQLPIDGDAEKFHLLAEKINKKVWTLKVSKVPNNN